MYYILDTARSSQIILPMQNLERTCKVDKEFEVVLLSSQTESRTSEGSKIIKNAYRNIRTKNSNFLVKK